MVAAVRDLSIEQGALFYKQFRWALPALDDPSLPGEGIDLSEATARLQMRKKYGEEIYLEATTENGLLALGADGSIVMDFRGEDTDALSVRSLAYDLEVVIPVGHTVMRAGIYRVLEGRVAVTLNITREGSDV